MGKEVTCWANWLWSVASRGVGLTHAKTSPRADRGGDTWTISTRQAGVNHPGFAAMSRHGRADSIRPLEPSDVDAAARLLAERHRRQRLAEPLLDPIYEDPAATTPEIEALLGGERASGWVALRDGGVAGYLIGVAKSDLVWGANAWVEAAGHAADEPALVRDLYAVAAAAWVGEGRTNHHVLVPASDAGLVDAWFTLDFGQQHLHAVVPAPPLSF